MRTRRRKQILLALILAVLALGLCALLIPSGPPDPIYNGKPLSYWLRQPPEQVPGGGWKIQTADFRIDTNAIPYLVYALELHDSAVRREYADLWPRLCGSLGITLPEPRDTVTIRRNSMLYLGQINTSHSPAALSALVRVLENSKDADFRESAAMVLGESKSKDPAVIRALVHGLEHKDLMVSVLCTNALQRLDPAALTNAVTK